MGEEQFDRVQMLFLAALELPEDQRASWLIQQCGSDQATIDEVRSLLKHDRPIDDPLESPLVRAIDPDRTMPAGNVKSISGRGQVSPVCGDQFLSRLVRVGLFSGDELSAVEQDLSDSDPSSVASKLVTDGKLTEYQATALLEGQPRLLIDKYLILDLIGIGGMGTVFKAIHRPMNRIVAFKMISKHLVASPDQVMRFQREVRVAATLENVNVVRAYDADQSNGVHFLVMEYVRGENLNKIVRRDGPLTVERAVDCVRQAASGLDYAHRRGVVHRDIKPSNLMQTRDMLVKVLDLGLADIDDSYRQIQQNTVVFKAEEATTQALDKKYHTEFGAVLGTAAFMAPEQSLDAASADNRADIYSLGCTLHYLLTGEPPYKAETSAKVLELHRESEIPPVRKLRPDVPESVDDIYRRMLAKKSKDRFQSMREVITAIEECGVGVP